MKAACKNDVHYCQVGWEHCSCGELTYEQMTTGEPG